jgi:hypothetical protein
MRIVQCTVYTVQYVQMTTEFLENMKFLSYFNSFSFAERSIRSQMVMC